MEVFHWRRHNSDACGGRWGCLLPVMEWVSVCSECVQWRSYMEEASGEAHWAESCWGRGECDCVESHTCCSWSSPCHWNIWPCSRRCHQSVQRGPCMVHCAGFTSSISNHHVWNALPRVSHSFFLKARLLCFNKVWAVCICWFCCRGFYVGVSSLQVTLPAEQCCTFRGSLAKLDILTGEVLWRTYTIPDNGGKLGGYSGGAVWGSSPAIDTKRNLVYIGTGNLYNAPAEVQQCQAIRNNKTTVPSEPDQCIGPDVHFDSILALDLDTGKIRWFRKFEGYDVFYFVCLVPNNPACPTGPNLDADFGEAPMLLTIFPNGTRRDAVVGVQKSGFTWALDRDTGDIVWFNVGISERSW